MNLKELSDVKELVEEAYAIVGECLDVVASEVQVGPDTDGEDESRHHDGLAVPGQGDGQTDDVPDPLVEVPDELARALVCLSEVLDITEPHRKRYQAQRDAASGDDKTGQGRARALAQRAIAEAKESKPNGAKQTTRQKRLSFRRS